MQQPGDQREMGAQVSNGGAGHHWPPAGDGPDCNIFEFTIHLIIVGLL